VSAQERARRLIDESVNMTVATVDTAGVPWVSPVFYVPDENYDLYWTSERTARHSENIRRTGNAAIVIVESDPQRRVDAVYMSTEATELTDPTSLARGVEIMLGKPQPDKWMITSSGDVTGDGPWRIYRAHPMSIEVRASDEVNGKPVARRIDADFRSDI
jgi:nitroimidazol reductase NimA-like FMN-containing flavoprotein (pyridoxamine 5'-phosphate oxidase superfamily)